MMSEYQRKWLPAEWMDETVPDMEGSPDAYIEREGDGWALRLPVGNASRSEDHEVDCWHTKIEPGQVVNFYCSESYGHRTVTVIDMQDEDSDRTFTVDAPYPDKANCFCVRGDPETLQETMAQLVSGADAAFYSEPLEPGEHHVNVYWWSDDMPFRFEVDADGAGRFVSCAGAN